MKTTKTFFLAITVVLLSAFATSCIPNIPGGNPTPTNSFNVNLTQSGNYFDTTTIVVDGDILEFSLISTFISGPIRLLSISTNNSSFEILNIKQYPYDYNANQYDYTRTPVDVNLLDSGVLVNDSYTANPWLTFDSYSYPPIINQPYTSVSSLYASETYSPSYIYVAMKKNVSQYIVLRKLKGTQHQYYWIKVKDEGAGSNILIKISNGKYQMDSITTGQ